MLRCAWIMVLLSGVAAKAAVPTAGYYGGQAIMYPYEQLFCPTNGGSQCYSIGHQLPKSAPLPAYYKNCTWADPSAPNIVEGWYRWAPRITPRDQVKYVGERVCFLEDRGEPHNINDLPKE